MPWKHPITDDYFINGHKMKSFDFTEMQYQAFYNLAIVQIDQGFVREPVYVRNFFERELGFAETAVVFSVADLLTLGGAPS